MPTTVNLYRNGNATSPRMDNVRSTDVTIQDRSGVPWVVGGSGGISTYDTRDDRRYWWQLPSGSAVPAGLNLVLDPDLPGHWLWEPGSDMTLANYKQLLLQVAPWERVTLMSDETGLLDNAPLSPAFAALSPKVARFLLGAVDAQLAQHLGALDTAGEDDASELTNDVMLYRLIQAQLRKRLASLAGPAGT